MSNPNEVKAVLSRAGVEIASALSRVESMQPPEMDNIMHQAQAFFDFNLICACAQLADLQAFFDFNGICSANHSDPALVQALHGVLSC